MTKIEQIKHLIADKGITRQKIAQMCKISYSALSKDLAGQDIKRISDDKLDKIIYYLEQVNTNDINLNL